MGYKWDIAGVVGVRRNTGGLLERFCFAVYVGDSCGVVGMSYTVRLGWCECGSCLGVGQWIGFLQSRVAKCFIHSNQCLTQPVLLSVESGLFVVVGCGCHGD